MSEQIGKVYLLGAGLGEIDYLTLRGRDLLAQAEVLIYDALVDLRMLELVPSNCLQIDVGKRGGQPSTPQVEINQLLVNYARQGRRVVRLKSGDPFIFGRAREEIEALSAANCFVEVVPGISSAIAAPLLAGIPLTDKTLSRSFAVVSAHQPPALDWESLARLDTLVVLMGGRRLREITQRLQSYKPPTTPIAIIRDGGRMMQQVWVGCLATIVEQTAGATLSPTVMVIGEVVHLRDSLFTGVMTRTKIGEPPMREATRQSDPQTSISGSQPLAGKTVLVTRSAQQSETFTKLLQQRGARVIEMPALEIGPPTSWEALDRAIAQRHEFDWLILTSANGVAYFFSRLNAQGLDARALAGIKIAVVGKKTAASLQNYGLQSDFMPTNFVADSLVEEFPDAIAEQTFLFPRVETGGRDLLVQQLHQQGARVVEVPAYQSRCPSQVSPAALAALQQKSVDIVTFASSKTVKHFHQLLHAALDTHSALKELLQGVAIAAIGPQTAQTCRQQLGRCDVEAQEYTLEGLIASVEQWIENLSHS